MRYFLTFFFFILSTSNTYAIDPDSLPDDPWMKNFWGGCNYNIVKLKHAENNNVFWRFVLEKGDVGGCSMDPTERHGASYWERKEVRGRSLKSGSTYEIQFKVRFIKGFEGNRETFFQIHGSRGAVCLSPLLMFKFGELGKSWSPDYWARLAITEHGGKYEVNHAQNFGPIDKIKGIWQHVKFIFETNVGTSKYWLYLGDKLLISNEEFDVTACKIPFIKFGIYRSGDPKYGKISIVDFDDVIVTKVR